MPFAAFTLIKEINLIKLLDNDPDTIDANEFEVIAKMLNDLFKDIVRGERQMTTINLVKMYSWLSCGQHNSIHTAACPPSAVRCHVCCLSHFFSESNSGNISDSQFSVHIYYKH